jgi:regulator of protease activity HflC (stomatin/prohibitin superfamily)
MVQSTFSEIHMKKIMTIIAVAALSACTQIDTGNIGVESTMGQVKKETMPPGVYMTVFKRVTEVTAKELLLKMDDMKPQTKDKITLADLDVDIYYQIDPAKASDIMTRWPGDMAEMKGEDGVRVGNNYVTRQAREAIYNAIAKYGSDTVHTERVSIAAEVVKNLQSDLDESAGKGWFFVRSANVRNLVTDPALEASIKEAANRNFQIAAKQKEVEFAKAEADRKRVEAQGDADAIRLRAAAITSQGGREYVELKAIEKWDGKLPSTMPGQVTPFVHIK